MQLTTERVGYLRRRFLHSLPNFEDFVEQPGDYRREERSYKEELVDIFHKYVRQEIFEGLPNPATAHGVAHAVHKVLTNPLRSGANKPQNLLPWRYSAFLRGISDDDAAIFANAFRDLLYGDASSPRRIEAFNRAVWPQLSDPPSSLWAPSRSFPTLFLTLLDPTADIFIRTDTFKWVFRALGVESPFSNSIFDAEQYRRSLELAEAVLAQLESWGWRPRDFIDVQGFLWVSQRSEEPDSLPNNSPSRSPFDQLAESLARSGLVFSSELLANYLLALQTKRFVLLTGISGTGKTRLAQAVAAHYRPTVRVRSAHAPPEDSLLANSEVVAVRPDWTDHRGLLGYFNPITQSYVVTPFLELLLRAGDEERLAEKQGRDPNPFFAILDEMNLARVEHYFADFLSCLESDEKLHLHDDEATEEGGTETGLPIPRRLAIPGNLFFTGTVNVDESTYMFSPKVLDRAFTLELNDVDLEALGTGKLPAIEKGLTLPGLPEQLIASTRPGADDWRAFEGLLDGDLAELVRELHAVLAATNRHFGYRVANEIGRFVKLAESQGDGSEACLSAALDLALLQKVLPKLHGTQQELEELLRDLFGFAAAGRVASEATRADRDWQAWRVERGHLHRAEEGQSPRSPRLPRTALKLWRMLERLRHQGFTSFIE